MIKRDGDDGTLAKLVRTSASNIPTPIFQIILTLPTHRSMQESMVEM